MKKTLVMLMTVAVAGMAVADISVDFKTTAPVSQEGGSMGVPPFLAPGTVALLVWSDVDNRGGAVDASGLVVGSNEVALETTAAVNAGVVVANGPSIYDFAGINSGFLYARLFDQSSISSGDWYLETAAIGAGLVDFDAANPSSIISSSFNAIPGVVNQQVVPEPATLGLMGVAGLGMFLARKKTRA